MEPTFKEREENGVYTAEVTVVMNNGTTISQKAEIVPHSLEEIDKFNLLKLGYSLEDIEYKAKEKRSQSKHNLVLYLYKELNKRLEYEKGFGFSPID